MTTLSPFQTLPSGVAVAIYNFARIFSLPGTPKGKVDPERTPNWALYRTCRLWYFIVLEHCYTRACLNFSLDKKICLSFPCLPREFNPRHGPVVYNQVKGVDLILPTKGGIFSNSILDDLDRVWGSTVVFPNAHVLRIGPNRRDGIRKPSTYKLNDANIVKIAKLIGHSRLGDEPTDYRLGIAGIQTIAKRIEQSMPKINTLQLVWSDMELSNNPIFDDLGSGIFHLLSVILNDFDAFFPEQYYLKHLLGCPELKLTTLYCDLCKFGPGILQLAYVHAPLLASINLKHKNKDELRALVQDENGNTVIYPRLKTLCVTSKYTDYCIAETNVSDLADPFPVLTQLAWESKCYFNSDILFRGSCKTIKKLMVTCASVSRGFKAYRAFEQGLFENLCYIWCADPLCRKPDLEYDEKELVDSLFRIASPSLSTLNFYMQTLDSHKLVAAIGKHSATLSIRAMDISWTQFRILDIVKAIKLLPTLEEFACGNVKELDSEEMTLLDGFVNRQDSYDQVLNKRLRYFHTHEKVAVSVERVALLVIMLAADCPSLAFVQTRDPRKVSIWKHIDSVLDEKPLCKYKGRMDNVKLV